MLAVVGGVIDGNHIPDRTSWKCQGCDTPWPCVSEQRRLLRSRGPTEVALLMGVFLIEAAAVLRDVPAGELYDRMVGWARAPQSSEAGL